MEISSPLKGPGTNQCPGCGRGNPVKHYGGICEGCRGIWQRTAVRFSYTLLEYAQALRIKYLLKQFDASWDDVGRVARVLNLVKRVEP